MSDEMENETPTPETPETPEVVIWRCASNGPAPDYLRCGLPSGHTGNHSALIPFSAPWPHRNTKDLVR
jgi:hypothetical protein